GAHRLMAQLQPAIVSAIGERSAHHTVVTLIMPIIGIAASKAQPGKPREGITQFTPYIQPFTAQVCCRCVFAMLMVIVIMIVPSIIMAVIVIMTTAMQGRTVRVAVLVLMAMARQTVIVLTIRISSTYIAPASYE